MDETVPTTPTLRPKLRKVARRSFLEQARKADASGNADACTEALREARRLYGLE
jgi:hypothetical protein